MTQPCGWGWEALTGDPLPWLLDERQPNLHWRVLTELVGRPADSPAVRRAQGGGSAADPVALLLAALLPDGTWNTGDSRWRRYSGPAWRFIAAVAWGADPSDPRLQAAAETILESVPGDGGVALRPGQPPSALATARLVQAVAGLGLARHLRVQEALAWFEEDPRSWRGAADQRLTTAVALLAALPPAGELRRDRLVARAVSEVLGGDGIQRESRGCYGHPNLGRTDASEALWALARARVPFEPRMLRPLERLQSTQLGGGRWPVERPVPSSIPVDQASKVAAGEPSQWITLRAVVVMNAYAVAAGLPRLFPQKPMASR